MEQIHSLKWNHLKMTEQALSIHMNKQHYFSLGQQHMNILMTMKGLHSNDNEGSTLYTKLKITYIFLRHISFSNI